MTTTRYTSQSTRSNPWIDQHIEAETVYQGGRHRVARRLVTNEYSGAPQPMPCPHCEATTYYKATIGAMKCPDCGGLAHCNGVPIGGRKY